MSSTWSHKHRMFVQEPMDDKAVELLPGINGMLGCRLRGKGFCKAYAVLGKFLILNRDVTIFVDWLTDTCGSNNPRQRLDSGACMHTRLAAKGTNDGLSRDALRLRPEPQARSGEDLSLD
ncbi:hypothetical protein LSAT2_011905 [Lamellibrachia satsuma]|nr:hypothetical protein LSAT2_011905 [Lamellibrachia satsuma]